MSNLPPRSNNSGLGNLGGSPGLGNLGGSSGLGSLAQSAREKHLKNARTILIILGILSCALNIFLYVNSENEVDLAVGQARAQNLQVDRETILRVVRLIYGASIVQGVVFIVLGLLVKRFPVPTTVLGLILYIGGIAGYAFLNPLTLVNMWLIKIIIIVGLVRAVQAGIAYQKETGRVVGKPGAVGLGADL